MKFNVLHVIRPAAGGMKNHLLSLLEHTNRELFEPAVACPPGSMAAEICRRGVPVFPIPLRGEISPRADLAAVSLLTKILREGNFTFMHAHSSKAGLIGRLAACRAGTPVVFFTAHNSIFYEQWPAWKKWLFATAESVLGRCTHRIFTVSEALRKELLAKEHLEPKRVMTVYNGIDAGRFQQPGDRRAVLRALGLPQLGQVVGTVARLATQKGIIYFLQAASMLVKDYQVNFVVVGDGPLRRELEAQAADLGLKQRVFFTGERRDIPDILAALDLFVLPSVTEGLPLTILEAMAAGKPVVATTAGGIPEIVVDQRTGLLVPPRDAQALAWAIATLLVERSQAAQFGRAGQQRVAERFTVETMTRKIENEYRALLVERGMLPGAPSTLSPGKPNGANHRKAGQ